MGKLDKSFFEKLPVENIKNISSLSGGDVNEAFKIETYDEPLFLLVQKNSDKTFYASEIEGLKKFEEAGVTAPKYITDGVIDGNAYLITSYLEEGRRGSQRELARLVLKLHGNFEPEGRFGFTTAYRGAATKFSNDFKDSWIEIFVNERLDGLYKELVEEGYFSKSDQELFKEVRARVVTELENRDSKPSLLHGDLWGGNYMFLSDGRPALFDPSPLYGDREFDLGITTVFGGFSDEFYDEYSKVYPIDNKVVFRMEFYRLYLLMVHLLKFGNTYKNSVVSSMQKIMEG